MWHKELDGKNDSEKCKFRVSSFCTGVGLDIGTKEKKINPNAMSVGGTKACDVKVNLHSNDSLAFLGDNYFDYVFSSHMLEEFSTTETILSEWWSKIKAGGYLILYCDDPDYSPKTSTQLCRVEKQKDLYWEDVWGIVEKFGNAEMIQSSRHEEYDEYSWQLVIKKTCAFVGKPKEMMNKPRDWGRMAFPRKKVTDKEVLVIRYGAFGDAIWATPILRELKKQGYYVVYNTSEVPAQVVMENPNIDEFLIQEGDSIAIEDDEAYWDYIGSSFDKVVNLCGIVEDKLLRVEGRTGYGWSKQKRHERCNKNYIDALMESVGFDEKGAMPELFFTSEEEQAAQTYIESLKDKFVILWSLSGSAYHKVYPYAEEVAKVLGDIYKDVEIITVGDDMCRIMEWEHPNTQSKSGKFTIRQSMLLTKYVDLVVGPETGILNAASCYDTPKIVFLSHSTKENLTKYWPNCIALEPDNCPCYPCHQLHLSRSCPKGNVKGVGALCAENISISKTIAAITKVRDAWQFEKTDKKWAGFTTAYDELSNRRAKRVEASFKYYHPEIPFFIYDIKDEEDILGEIRDSGPYPAGVSWRPRLCQKLLEEYDGVMYFDDDTIISSRLDEFLIGDFEVAGSLNVKGMHRESFFNDGVFALTCKGFADQWTNGVYDKFSGYGNDQYVFNFLTNTQVYNIKVVDAEKVYYNERSREFWDKITIKDDKLYCDNRQLKVLHWAGGFEVPGNKLSCASFSDEVREFLDNISGTKDFTTIKGEKVWWPTNPLKPVDVKMRGLKITCRRGEYNQRPADLSVVEEVISQDAYRLNQLKRIIEPKVILDIGGHIGTFGMMAKKMWPDALLIAVEANEESCSIYRRNMINNGFKNYHILNNGMSYNKRETCLVSDLNASGGGILSTPEGVGNVFNQSEGSRTTDFNSIPTITIEDIIKKFKLESIDLAKWDIEGSELGCWEAMTPEAAAKIKYMVGEFHIPLVPGGINFNSSPIQKAEYWEIAKDKFPHLVFDHYSTLSSFNISTGDYIKTGLGLFEAVPKGTGIEQEREDFFC